MADSQRAVANLLNNDQTEQGDGYIDNALLQSDGTPFSVNAFWVTEYIPVSQGDYYYYNDLSRSSFAHINFYDSNENRVTAVLQKSVMSREAFNLTKLTIPSDVSYIRMNIDKESTKNGLYKEKVPSYIAYPYGWQHSLRKFTTATEAVENPLYSDGTAITAYTLKGNTVQNGTPTPSAPIAVQGVGELDSGQYKIPISNGQQTIDIYIGDLPLLKSLDGTAVDEISNGTLTRRVDSDGSVLPTPTTTQITMPSIPTTEGANSITVDTTVQPSEFTATWTGWHNANVKEWDGSDWN